MANGDNDIFIDSYDPQGLLDLGTGLDVELEKLRLREVQILRKQSFKSAQMPEKSVETHESTLICSCDKHFCNTTEWKNREVANSSSTTTTCTVMCSVLSSRGTDESNETPSDDVESKGTTLTNIQSGISKKSDLTSKKVEWKKSEVTCDFTYKGCSISDEFGDETDRLVELRATDYSDLVDNSLKVVIAVANYPKAKMRLQQIGQFQQCLTDIMEMQLKAGILKKLPVFLDYYLNRGALVCICKDEKTRDWLLRISPGLQERMKNNLIFLKCKVKRLCLALLKIPKGSWPATATDVFKLLQYFNSPLNPDLWEIYAQKIVNDVEYTSFSIDRCSGEIIRGPRFKNIIDYSQMQLDLTGYTEIYYDCLMSDFDDLCSMASRAKLLNAIKVKDIISAQESENNMLQNLSSSVNVSTNTKNQSNSTTDLIRDNVTRMNSVINDYGNGQSTYELASEFDCDNNIPDDKENGSDKGDADSDQKDLSWSEDNKIDEIEESATFDQTTFCYNSNEAQELDISTSEHTESLFGSTNTIERSSTTYSDGKKGLVFHRRTNYLHVEVELKVAVVLEGYPNAKLEGSHVRRLKSLFKEHLHKDLRMHLFSNLIIPKFLDVYLTNGALIYICDCVESKEYLFELLPKFVKSTRLKLVVKDLKDLVRYTRVIMQLPKEHAQVESIDILTKLQLDYTDLKPDIWKYYSDFPGKQKRQFGLDPESLAIVKSPDFNPEYEGSKIVFKVIDRKVKDNKQQDDVMDELRDSFLKIMYEPIDAEVLKKTESELRANRYMDVIPDDFKLYVGPATYPELRIDENMFYTIKECFESLAYESYKNDENTAKLPTFHDFYLYDGVIFIICKNMNSRDWIDQTISGVNSKLQFNLKTTEFRGVVGIVTMTVNTNKDPNDVMAILQKQNPRLRTKYWRVINSKIVNDELVSSLQIDKLSAQVIRNGNFNGQIGNNTVTFNLGFLCPATTPELNINDSNVNNALENNLKTEILTIRARKNINIKKIKAALTKRPELKITHWKVVKEVVGFNDKIYEIEIDSESSKTILDPNFILKIGKRKINFNVKDETWNFDASETTIDPKCETQAVPSSDVSTKTSKALVENVA